MKSTLILVGCMIVIAFVSAVLIYWRIPTFGDPKEIAAKGLASVRKSTLVFYGIFLPIVVGLVCFFWFRYLNAHTPDTARTTFLLITVVIGVIFEILAAVVFKMRGFAEFTALHLLYIAGFGWIMPLLLAR